MYEKEQLKFPVSVVVSTAVILLSAVSSATESPGNLQVPTHSWGHSEWVSVTYTATSLILFPLSPSRFYSFAVTVSFIVNSFTTLFLFLYYYPSPFHLQWVQLRVHPSTALLYIHIALWVICTSCTALRVHDPAISTDSVVMDIVTDTCPAVTGAAQFWVAGEKIVASLWNATANQKKKKEKLCDFLH